MSTIREINDWKKKRKAIIIAHNYQPAEIQDIADFLGDSLDLSRKAAKTDAEVIVFCGVHFMAETAYILSPQKKVLLPDPSAGCPLADTINVTTLKKLKAENPGAKVVCYVNTSAEIKAESDICCTSQNAVEVVRRLGDVPVIFIPDRNLGDYVSKKLGKKLILHRGCCPTHDFVRKEDILEARSRYPEAVVMAHPECRREVLELCDYVGGTGGMVKYARETNARFIIVGTEKGIIHRLKKENPEKEFIPASEKFICPDMKLITLEKVLNTLVNPEDYEVRVPGNILNRAHGAIDAMLK
ncbi:MAG: quinolinate synthase NadA [Candidatus Eremiobacteraeota bacterium]|nr:quinolinate synthase NadA [Candidatus Eremiobacteraeota bacterium]